MSKICKNREAKAGLLLILKRRSTVFEQNVVKSNLGTGTNDASAPDTFEISDMHILVSTHNNNLLKLVDGLVINS